MSLRSNSLPHAEPVNVIVLQPTVRVAGLQIKVWFRKNGRGR